MFNLAKLTYKVGVKLASTLGLYRERTEKYFQSFREYMKGKCSVLDLGSGSGSFSNLFAENGCFVVSLDIDMDILKDASSGENIHKICGDAQHLPLRQNSVDVVVAISVLEHLQKPHLAINEVERVLKPSGFFIVQLPNLQYFLEPHTKFPLFFLLPRSVKEKIGKQLNYSYINFAVTLKETLKFMENSFTIKRILPMYHKLRTPPWPPAWVLVFQKTSQHDGS